MATAAAPLEDENLLPEILLRLEPLPSALPRASLVCNRWRRLVSDHLFIRRFRAHHRRNPPPLLGFFYEDIHSATGSRNSVSYKPILDPPNRVPAGRFSLHHNDGGSRWILCCRDGLLLTVNTANHETEGLVWDPVTGDQHRFAVPWVINDRDGTDIMIGAVLRTAGIQDHLPFRFQVVMVGINRKNERFFTCVYSSETGGWGDPVWASLDDIPTMSSIRISISSTLVENSLYWMFGGNKSGILEFDLDRQHLSVILVPLKTGNTGNRSFQAMPAEGGGLGILELLNFDIHLWKRKNNYDGVVSWVPTKTIELDHLLSLDKKKSSPMMMGYCEDNNVVILWTLLGIFMVELESLKFKKLPMDSSYGLVHPFTSVYIPGI